MYNNQTKKINKINHELTKIDSINSCNNIKAKNYTYSPFHTNIHTIEKNIYTQTYKNTCKLKKPTKVLSTVQKLISNKISRVPPNTNSIFQLNKNESNNSFKQIQNNRYGNDGSNNKKKSKLIHKIKYQII